MFFWFLSVTEDFWQPLKKCQKPHGWYIKGHDFFPRVNKNQKKNLSDFQYIDGYFHIFLIFSIVMLNFIFEKVGWLQNMKSNFNVFFFVFISIFLLSFLTFIRFFGGISYSRKMTDYRMWNRFLKFFHSFFRYFLLTFSPFKNMFWL